MNNYVAREQREKKKGRERRFYFDSSSILFWLTP